MPKPQYGFSSALRTYFTTEVLSIGRLLYEVQREYNAKTGVSGLFFVIQL